MKREDKILIEVYESIKRTYSADNLRKYINIISLADEKEKDFAFWKMKSDLGEQYTAEELLKISGKCDEIFNYENFKKIVNDSSEKMENIPESFQRYVRSRYFIKLNRGIGRGDRRGRDKIGRRRARVEIQGEPARVYYPSGNNDYNGIEPESREFPWTTGQLIGFN